MSFSIYIVYYHISQNYFDNAKQLVKQEHISQNLIIEKESVFNTLTNIELQKRYKKLKIEGSVDIKNLDSSTKIPPIVIDINGILWEKIEINKNYYNDYNTFNFEYDFYTPFITNLKNKNIKIYFWNTSKSNIEIKNTDISIIAK